MTEIEVLDPATAEPIGSIEDMDELAVGRAVARARTVFNEGGWWPRPPDGERGRILARAAELVRRDAAELARLETLDVGKPLAESEGDVEEVARILEYYAGWPTKAPGEAHAVSADALQVYDGLEIVTGAPSERDREALEHRLVGTVPLSERFSAGAYAAMAHAEIDCLLEDDRRGNGRRQ